MSNDNAQTDADQKPAVGAPLERHVRPLAWMPVLGYPLAIPITLLDERQAMENHGQTLERLAERGGLGLAEAAAVAERRRWRNMTADEALAALKDVAMRRGIRAA